MGWDGARRPPRGKSRRRRREKKASADRVARVAFGRTFPPFLWRFFFDFLPRSQSSAGGRFSPCSLIATCEEGRTERRANAECGGASDEKRVSSVRLIAYVVSLAR
jgi:hypothetical protein